MYDPQTAFLWQTLKWGLLVACVIGILCYGHGRIDASASRQTVRDCEVSEVQISGEARCVAICPTNKIPFSFAFLVPCGKR